MHQRNAVEKEVILSEIQMLKEKAKTATNLTFLKEAEKDYWNKLLDSNIRAGTMACMWCMKAQVVRRLSVAFFKWKYTGAAVPTAQNSESNRKSLKPQEIPMSAVLANAISLMNQLKESEVERDLSTQLFMSPSASVQVANEVATSILQQDLQQQHHLVPPGGSFRWESRRSRASSFGPADAPAAAAAQLQEEESLAVHNKQRLAYLLRSLQQQHPDSADGSTKNTSSSSVDAQLLEALQNPNVDAAAKRDILIAMSQDLTTQTGALGHSADGAIDPDLAVAARSSLSLLRATGATPPASARRSQAAASARSLSPNGRMHTRTAQSYGTGAWASAAPSSQQNAMGFFRDDPHAADSHSVGSGYRSTTAAAGAANGHVYAPFSDVSSLHSAGGEGRHRDSGNWREHEFMQQPQPSAAEAAFFSRHNRTYPVSSSGQPMSLRSQEVSSSNVGSSSKARCSVPRYLMPTNSYQKKRVAPPNSSSGVVAARGGSNGRGTRSSSAGRRSHSPSMITNSNSKHVANLRGSPSALPPSRTKAMSSLQSPPDGRQRQPMHSEERPGHSYANMSVFDYHQRSSGSRNGHLDSASGGYIPAPSQPFYHQQEPQVHQQETQYYHNQPHSSHSHQQHHHSYHEQHQQQLPPFPPSAQTSLSLPLPPPFPAGAAVPTDGNRQQLPLRDAALASIAEVDRMVPQQQAGMMAVGAPQQQPVDYCAYDAYHSNALLTNSTEMQEAEAAQQKGVVNPHSGRPRAESLDMLLSEDDPHRPSHYQSGSDYSAQYYQQQTPEHSAFPVQHTNAAPRSTQSQDSRRGGGKSSSGGRPKMDKAQLALFMHGDVHGSAAKWHATLRR